MDRLGWWPLCYGMTQSTVPALGEEDLFKLTLWTSAYNSRLLSQCWEPQAAIFTQQSSQKSENRGVDGKKNCWVASQGQSQTQSQNDQTHYWFFCCGVLLSKIRWGNTSLRYRTEDREGLKEQCWHCHSAAMYQWQLTSSLGTLKVKLLQTALPTRERCKGSSN